MTIKQATKYAKSNFQFAINTNTLNAIKLDTSNAVNSANCLGERFFSLNMLYERVGPYNEGIQFYLNHPSIG